MTRINVMFKLLAAGLFLVVMVLPLTVHGYDAGSPIQIQLSASKSHYESTEPVVLQVSVYNAVNSTVATQVGFFKRDWHLAIWFTAPDGTPVRQKYLKGGSEPPGVFLFNKREAVFAELVPTGAEDSTLLNDARIYYDLNQYGTWSAVVQAPLYVFHDYSKDEITGNRYGFLNPKPSTFNPLTSNKVAFEILPPEPVVKSALEVFVEKQSVGSGSNPGTKKEALNRIPVRVYRVSDIPPDFQPPNWQNYDAIAKYVKPVHSGVTASDGLAKFYLERDEYLVMAKYNKAPDFKHLGALVTTDEPEWMTPTPLLKKIKILEVARTTGPGQEKKLLAGTTRRERGSDLLITEPEFVTWDSTEELYPFVFEAVGDWDVTTSVSPPEGFTADYDSLSAEVVDEVEAVQFTIVDVGSKWEETDVTVELDHNGKKKKIKSKVGIKLSKKLAKEKKLGVYGHTVPPGPFKGGKKVKE
jgi:hypothetical protein